MPERQSSRVAALIGAAIAMAVLCGAASGEGAKFPNRPIHLIVPYAAGGAVDQTARFLQQGMEKRLGQSVLVINRPGASTTIGTLQAARAAPDGHTIVMVSLPHVSNYTLLKEVPYAQSDFIPITTVTNQWSVLVVNPSLPLKTLADLIAYVKARPGEVNYGTFGIGTSAHLAALLFEVDDRRQDAGRALSRRRADRGRRHDRRGADGIRHRAVRGRRHRRRPVAGDRGHLGEASRAVPGCPDRPRAGTGLCPRLLVRDPAHRPARRIRSSGGSTTSSRTPWRSPTCRSRSGMRATRCG